MKTNLILVLVIILTVCGVVYLVHDMLFEPFEKKYERKQLDALIAMARADTIGVPISERCAAQKAVADVALRRQSILEKRDPNATVSFLQMLRNCTTLYPDNWKHSSVCFRSVWAIWGSPRYKEAPWDDVKVCVTDKLRRGFDSKSCATHYTRDQRRYELLTDEKKASDEIRSRMKPDPVLKFTGMEFWCP